MAALAVGAGAAARRRSPSTTTRRWSCSRRQRSSPRRPRSWSSLIGNVDQLVDGGRGKRQLALLAEQRGNALATATRLSEVAERASTREAVLDLLIEGVRAAVGSDEVAVIEADAGDRDAVSTALSDVGMVVHGAVVVPLLSSPALSLATSRAAGRSEEVVAQLESLAAAARPALAAVEARARVDAARAARSAAAQVLRRLLSLRDVADVADAFTGELRERLPLRAVGLRLIDEPEHWTPERPPEHATLEERALVLGDTGLGTLWLWLERPLRTDELALLDLCCDHAPPAFGLARMRASLREARLAQAALVRAAETVGGELDLDVLLGKLAAASARMLGADAAAVWVHDATSEHNRVAASYGFDDDLQGQQFPAGAGAAGAAIAGLRPVQRSGGEPDAVSHPVARGGAPRARRAGALGAARTCSARRRRVHGRRRRSGSPRSSSRARSPGWRRSRSRTPRRSPSAVARAGSTASPRWSHPSSRRRTRSRMRSRRSRARPPPPSRPIAHRCATARACPSSPATAWAAG